MSLPVPFEMDGYLPLGRWTMTEPAAAAYVGIPDTSRRKKLWDDWHELVAGLRTAVGAVPACWLAGSFFTTKEQPGDLDCTFVLKWDDVDAVLKSGDVKAAQLLHLVADSQVRQLGLELDTYVLPWQPRPGTLRGSPERRERYLESRGYWDDLWCRHREGEIREQSLLRRGYAEVILDGYR